MKKGFTLIELLIVTVVIATLMGVVFRLAGVGGNSSSKANTVAKLQRLENALSGYYAAFGSYPPVPLHGYHDYRHQLTGGGIQKAETSSGGSLGSLKAQVRAACRAQPIAAHYPFDATDPAVRELLEVWVRTHDGVDAVSALGSPGSLTPSEDFVKMPVFKFGLMSFLLPRYLFMMKGDEVLYRADADHGKQWNKYNRVPADPFLGGSIQLSRGGSDSWAAMRQTAGGGVGGSGVAAGTVDDELKIMSIPSQAVCARWIQNLEGIVSCSMQKSFFGVTVSDASAGYLDGSHPLLGGSAADFQIGIYDMAGQDAPVITDSESGGGGGGSYFIQDGMTVKDGWGNEFYYYSPYPYQSYRLWSAGPNGDTFPPWMDVQDLSSSDRATALEWMGDDIVHMTN